MTVAGCPSCGAPVEFAIGSSNAVVCSYCHSIVSRSDRGVEAHGKTAALIDTGSVLRIGLRGSYRGQQFRISGRTQMRHGAGGMWDEWYAAFDDGRWGWLAEAQGRFYITFRVAAEAPAYERLEVATRIPELDDLTVAEFGTAAIVAAEGELPWVPEPGSTYQYADLTGDGRRFATIDYGEEPPIVFKGYEATLDQLGLEEVVASRRRVGAVALNCTQCGGALELRAPEAERIFCPYCGAGHDINAGNKLAFFQTLKKKRVTPAIPLGSKGTIDETEYVVAGFMERSVTFDQVYYWTEYLLYNREQGYRWLVNSDDHWSFVTPLRPGEVDDHAGLAAAKVLHYEGRRYRLYQEATATVTYVLGEFYWKVEVGEEVDTSDYIAPPFGISKEVTRSGPREVAYSHARYVKPDEVESIFGLERLPRPSGIGTMQPYTGAKLYRPWAAFIVLLIVVAIAIAAMTPSRQLLDRTWHLAGEPAMEDGGRVVFSDPFTISGKSNVMVEASANVDNSWAYVAGDLVNVDTNRYDAFEFPLEYYHGVDDGESWSEGSRDRRVFLARPEPGSYALRLAAEWQAGKEPPAVRVTVREGVFRWTHFFFALVAISLFPLISAFLHLQFEAARWRDSDFSPFGTSSGSDDEE